MRQDNLIRVSMSLPLFTKQKSNASCCKEAWLGVGLETEIHVVAMQPTKMNSEILNKIQF